MVSAHAADTLVLYYSLSGNTSIVAEELQKILDADIVRIETQEAYPADFHAVVDQARAERGRNYLPPLKPVNVNLSKYQRIFLGFPVWSSSIPQPMKTFLSQHSLNGKEVYPFCTHDGYGPGRSANAIQEFSPQAKMGPIFDLLGSDARIARAQLLTWVKSLNLAQTDTNVERPTVITVKMDGQEFEAVMNDSPEAKQFVSQLPVTVNMVEYGRREFYGSHPQSIEATQEGNLFFKDGEITYCAQNNSVAIFYSQSSRPNLTMHVIPMGQIQGDLKAFFEMDDYETVEFLKKKKK